MAKHGKAQWKALAHMQAALQCRHQWVCDCARQEPAAAVQHTNALLMIMCGTVCVATTAH